MIRQPRGSEASFADRLFCGLQWLLPTRALSALMFHVAEFRAGPFKNALIRWFVHKYVVDLNESEWSVAERYENFNAFFTRALRPGARPQPEAADQMSSPVDGTVSQAGAIREGALLQAKGHQYTVAELLADAELARNYANGSFCTLYLAPHNYHRVHMPCSGELRAWAYVPGRLFSVNPRTARTVPRLFARNERMVAVFETQFGPLAVIMVGAIIVGGIDTVWSGRLTPPHQRHTPPTYYRPMAPVRLLRGAELGRFHMGSTVILLAPAGALRWNLALTPGREVRVGQELATMLT